MMVRYLISATACLALSIAMLGCTEEAVSPGPSPTSPEAISETTPAPEKTPDSDITSSETDAEPNPSASKSAEPIAQTPTNVSNQPANAAKPEINTFNLDELFAQEGGGCGMTLYASANDWENFVFTRGIDSPALMKIDDQWVRLNLTDSKGEEFYGQNTSQTMVSEDGSLTVTTEVTLGELGEIESVAVSDAILQVTRAGATTELRTAGDAGC